MQLDFNHGGLLLVGGAITWAFYTVLLRWRPPGIAISTTDAAETKSNG